MGKSMLNIIGSIFMILIVGVQGAKIGDECTDEYICSEGSCIDGVCQLSTNSEIKCGNFICKSNEICEYPLVKCKEGAICPTPPPKCFPIPAVDPIQPDKPKCGKTFCQADEKCITRLIRCMEGSVCEPEQSTCIPKSDLVVDPYNPCASTTCLEGYDCIPSEENPSIADCKLRDPCSTIRCKAGYTCNVVTLNCLVEPCPPPYGECVQTNPCASTTCLEGYDCIPSEENPSIADCILRDPCSTIRCKAGYICNVVILNCLVEPCPPPYGECVPTNPCASTNCLEGNVCTQNEDDPSVAECVLNPCAISLCKSGTTCQPVIENCINPPCSFPKAQCVSDEDFNPCALVDCRSGYTCTNVLVDNCETSPSPKFRAACEPC